MKIFVSVGSTFTTAQDRFVISVENHLRAQGFEPKTVGRNTFGSQQPLKAIEELMDSCSGVVVIALERKFIGTGVEKRGSGASEVSLSGMVIPTPWVQVEAAMAYSRRLPLLLIAEEGLHEEGLIDEGFDWYVQRLKPVPSSLGTTSFAGVFADWKDRVLSAPPKLATTLEPDTANLTIGQILRGLKVSHLWSLIAALLVVACALFSAGVAAEKMTHGSPSKPTVNAAPAAQQGVKAIQ
jgi:hypothetical protein